jgi:hypothetical protein
LAGEVTRKLRNMHLQETARLSTYTMHTDVIDLVDSSLHRVTERGAWRPITLASSFSLSYLLMPT